MERKINKVWCMFEQSGCFKNEFKKLGIDAVDLDIQNNRGETDYQIDLFAEIENAYRGGQSVFDEITQEDLIFAFFPCVYFSCMSQMSMSFNHRNYKNLTLKEKTDKILERSHNREYYWGLLVRLVSICLERNLRIIIENPWAMQTFLKGNFIAPPTIIDNDRTLRGDYFIKPTAYWFFNIEPTHGESYYKNDVQKHVMLCKPGESAGICSEERSMISPEYAKNFIADFILGEPNENTLLTLF